VRGCYPLSLLVELAPTKINAKQKLGKALGLSSALP